ncbi:MAG: DUF1835 domain-containing protein [Vicinamibacterales bacterium]
MLHVLNGDSARTGLERSGIPGSIVVWPDVLYEGPTPLATGEEWIQARAGFLASVAEPPDPDIVEGYRRNDAALEAFRDHDEIVFWLEHDLFDQLLLIRHLWWLGLRAKNMSRPTLSLVCRDIYLGPLKPEQFPPLFAERQPITATQIETGSNVWRAFCAADPRPLKRLATQYTDYTEFPFLRAAVLRHLEEFPSAVNGLSRTESQMLRVLEKGPASFSAAFRASTDLEERMFMGDLSFWQIARQLASAAHPLIAIDAPSMAAGIPKATLEITETGRDVLAGRADYVRLNGIDRWLGGVHLTAAHCYRWNGRELVVGPR